MSKARKITFRPRRDAPLVCMIEYPPDHRPESRLVPLRRLRLTPEVLKLGREVLAHLKAAGEDPLTSPVWAVFADAIGENCARHAVTLVNAGVWGRLVYVLSGPPPEFDDSTKEGAA
jgi:hypothetical protein